jgi:hypothetical protein
LFIFQIFTRENLENEQGNPQFEPTKDDQQLKIHPQYEPPQHDQPEEIHMNFLWLVMLGLY